MFEILVVPTLKWLHLQRLVLTLENYTTQHPLPWLFLLGLWESAKAMWFLWLVDQLELLDNGQTGIS